MCAKINNPSKVPKTQSSSHPIYRYFYWCDEEGKEAHHPVEWSGNECESAFQGLKERICSPPVLHSPDFNRRFLVQVDASGVGIGAVLAQGESDEEKPVLYLSRKLLPCETRYSTIEKECLAITWALDSHRYVPPDRPLSLNLDPDNEGPKCQSD